MLTITTVLADFEPFLANRILPDNRRYESFLKVLDLLKERRAVVLVETGTARYGDQDFAGDGGSTIIFGHWAQVHNSLFYSIDINIMIDDCNIVGGGKGSLVIDFLLRHGWKIIQNSYQVIMVKT